MARLVLGIAASHSTLMNREPLPGEQPVPGSQEFKETLAAARQMLVDARPDAVLVVGSNHFRGIYLDLMPQFVLGVEECIGMGEAGTPSGPLTVHGELGHHVVSELVENEGFDVAFSQRLEADHGITHALQYLLPDRRTPIVPLIVNVFAPPMATVARSQAIGEAIRRAIESMDSDLRVAVVASGGLSHQLPWPDWRTPQSDDDEFLVEAWLEGRKEWQTYTERRRSIISGGRAQINAEFDQELLADLVAGSVPKVTTKSTLEILELAGNGGQEIRTWVIAAAVMNNTPAKVLFYQPIPEWLIGAGAVVFEPTA